MSQLMKVKFLATYIFLSNFRSRNHLLGIPIKSHVNFVLRI